MSGTQQVEEISLSPSELVEAIKTSVKAKRPLMIWGATGSGKSSIVQQVTNDMGCRLIDERPAQRDPVDYRGVPEIINHRTVWTLPDFLPDENDTTPTTMFFDEISAAPPAVQVVLYQITLERKIGTYKLPDSVAIIAAGNRETDRAVAGRMSTALASRFFHVTLQVDLNDWCRWAIKVGIKPETVAFVRMRPDLLHKFDPTKNTEKAFPCPRTWHMVSDLQIAGIDPAIEYRLLSGVVGQGAAGEYVAFLKIYRSLVSPDVILLNPDKAPIPKDEPSAMYAVCSALSRRASPSTIDRIVTYANRLPDEWSVMMIKDCSLVCPDSLKSAGFVQWAVSHPNVMF